MNNYTGEKVITMGQKGNNYQTSFPKQCVNQESRSHSLPDSLIEENNDTTNENHTQFKQDNDSPTTASNEWFKTWPERCDKVKTNENSPELISNASSRNTLLMSTNCDSTKNVNKTKITFNEALQNISLAYSPITKQLHLVEKPQNNENVENEVDNNFKCNGSDEVDFIKKGHRRIQAGSYSSTVSNLSGLSEPSTSGSLLDAEERSISSLEENNSNTKNTFSNFFSRNVFSWKNGENSNNSVWKLFGKISTEDVAPINGVISSAALIQLKRPSNLPAKADEEEKRHQDEYKAMLQAAKKKESQNSVAKRKQQKLQMQQEELAASATKHFVTQVLPNWENMRKTKKTRDLWWQGLPSSVRGKVWFLAIGNELNISRPLYEICLSRAQNRLNSPESSHTSSNDQESSMDVIQLDISRTFPNLCIFQEGGPYSEVLHSLLAAYVCYRPDVGYVQGMSYIAAILIINMDQYEAFVCFANLLNQPLHLTAFSLNQPHMDAYYEAYNQLLQLNLPKLYSHFEASGLTPDLYLLDWIYTIFAKAMPLDIACRVWDIFLRDGYEFIFKTALGILHLNQDRLLRMDFLHGAQFLTHLPDDMSSDTLFKSIQLVSTNMGKITFSQIVEKCKATKSTTALATATPLSHMSSCQNITTN
ncbi:unnamed protein product [Brassicogethes aeneus]|uniref:Rab-GAP TBC domain-containing protein n=1 Tax=Brassicogethes aeneus TaxID=1431903 RepID=A0A9P0F8X2_BRAAE|nr:unnamed protein product [Brassicogethes aeneus]